MDYTVHVDRPPEEAIHELVNALERKGLHVMTTFDLQLARANQVDCHCPHHSTERCTCQYAVLMVYKQKRGAGPHRTITAHGRDREMWLSLLESPTLPTGSQPDYEALGRELLQILLGLGATSRTEVTAARE